jgi:heme/copper-type cytochrome/quinol oxidase subunit 2
MDIETYLNVFNIKHLYDTNPSIEDVFDEFKKDSNIDLVSYNLKYEFILLETSNKSYTLTLQNNSYDIIKNISFTLPTKLIINDIIHDNHIILCNDKKIQFELSSDGIIPNTYYCIEFVAYTFSKVVHHEFVHYRKNNIFKI